ncbi:MAG: DUF6176 family protein [Thermomicrobiales bacterium]|nr:DUF6176 family protein [Thermomicrobiales bacterium]
MDQICFAVPILPGKVDVARAFMTELETERKADYDRSERRIGITKEVWFLANLPSGEHFVAYMESENFAQALQMFSQSQDAFDRWFKERLAEATGLDLANPPTDMSLPEMLSSYQT